MKTSIAFLILLACSDPSFNSDKPVCDTLMIRTMNNRFLNDSLKDAIQINSLKARIDTLEYQLEYVNDKSDTALIMVTNIDKKALRRYNAGHFFGGVADGLSGGRASDIANLFKRKKK